MLLDLNAKRAARAKARGEGMQMILGEETFDLVGELPLEIGELAENGKVYEAFAYMLARPDEDWDRLKACRPSFNDVMDVVEFFGAQMGESLKSTASSTGTGPPSKPTSSGSTDSTSQNPATAAAELAGVASQALFGASL